MVEIDWEGTICVNRKDKTKRVIMKMVVEGGKRKSKTNKKVAPWNWRWCDVSWYVFETIMMWMIAVFRGWGQGRLTLNNWQYR